MDMISADSWRPVRDHREWMRAEYRGDINRGESVGGSWNDHGGPDGYIGHLAELIVLYARWPFQSFVEVWLPPSGPILVDGHHRTFAAAQGGLERVPCVIDRSPRYYDCTVEELMQRRTTRVSARRGVDDEF